MTRRQRVLALAVGIAGAIASVLALVGFLLKILHNGLEFPGASPAQAFYKAVGAAYSDGFVAGFSLCFCLTLLAVAVGTWFESRRSPVRRAVPARGEPEPSAR